MAGVSDAGTLGGDASAEEREAAVHDVIQTIARTTFDLDAVLQTVIEMHSGYLFLMSISDGSALAVNASRPCDVGLVAYEMAVLVEKAGSALTPCSRMSAGSLCAEVASVVR